MQCQLIQKMDPAQLPCHGSGGIVYTDQMHQKFRGLKIKGGKNTETSRAWGTKRTKSEAWEVVTEAFTKHAKKK